MENNSAPQSAAVAASMPASSSAANDLPLSPNAMSALCYFFPPVAVAALVMKQFESEAEVRFNAMQSLVVTGAAIMGSIALGIVTGMITAMASLLLGALQLYGTMSVLFTALSGFSALVSLGLFALWVALIIAAANGKRLTLPYLGSMAARMAQR